MEFFAIIIALVSLGFAVFVWLKANSNHHILNARIERLKDKVSMMEHRISEVRGSSNRGNNRQAGPPQEQQVPKPKPQQPRPQQPQQQGNQQPVQQQQPRKKKESRRREPMEGNQYEQVGREQPGKRNPSLEFDMVGRELIEQMDQQVNEGGKKYAIIPEDGVIRIHQLQQQPDSDSYLEVDIPADRNSGTTSYRFNLSGNHAFVIAQGIDRLENAFAFEKPSNRMVNQVVLQGDGILTKVNNGWRIQEKARIDFR